MYYHSHHDAGVFKWAARYNSGRLTVMEYIIVLDEDSPISLAVKTIKVSCIVQWACQLCIVEPIAQDMH